MTGLPPSLAGAVQSSATEPSPAVPVTAVGAPGALVPAGREATVTSSKSEVTPLPSFQSWRIR